LEPALAELRTLHGTRIVLGLRDVLDDAETAAAEWRAQRGTETVRAYYDELWVYGDRRIHDVAVACALPPAIAARATYPGYLALRRADQTPQRPPMLRMGQPYVLCTVGGGSDGGALARAFAGTRLPPEVAGILVTGPQLPSAERAAIADAATESGTELHVVDFHPSLARWLPGAAAIVAMGGYNTVAEIVATDVPALVVPRHHPRLEQRIRAEELGRHGLLDWLHPQLANPDTLGTWLAEAVERGPTSRTELSRDGLVAARTRATELLRMEAADVAL
jgi:predicted glycosyltransferase